MTRLRAILPLLARFLRVAYGMNLQRSLAPFGQAYYNFGRILVEVFSRIGLIDKTHPWLRNTVHTRPLEVLSYACARADWKKPLAMPTVMAASITLMLACAALATTGLVTSTLLGAGDAYASMFTPASPGSDMALRYMSNSFGIEIPGVPMAALDGVVGGFQRMMALYSMAMLVLAGFILLYILISAIAATAHEGRFGGSGFNQIWTPIRLIVAIGLLVPLPMVGGYNGYNSGQFIVMKIAEWGSGMASSLWIPFATALAERGDVLATPNVVPAANAVRGVLINEFCMSRYNKINTIILGNAEPPVIDRTVTSGGITKIFYSTTADIQNDYCGVTTYQRVIGANLIASNISAGFATAYGNMRAAVQNFADTLNTDAYIELTSGLPAAGREDAIKLYFGEEFVNIVDEYQKDLAAVINATVAAQGTSAQDAMTAAIVDQGWAGAAIWFNTIARMNSEILAAARGIPASQAPSLGNAATTNEAPSQIAQNVNRGLTLVKTLADNLEALYPGLNGGAGFAANYGAGLVGNVYTPAVTTGLDNTNTMGGKISGAAAQMMADMLVHLKGGPWGAIGTGAEANLSQLNPLAQLAAVGEWLIDKSLVTMAGGLVFSTTVPVGLSMLLFSISTMGFGAGILLFYVTPLMPFIRFLFAIVGWLLNILEAIIAIPLVAIAHLNTHGDGISGDMARSAYFMILSIFLRPALLIVGMVIALMMFTVSVGILNEMYRAAVVGFMGTGAGNAGGVFSVIMYTIMYVTIAYGLCNMCFKLIEEIPNHALKWINQQSAREITQDERVEHALTHSGNQFLGIGSSIGNRLAGSGGGPRLPVPK